MRIRSTAVAVVAFLVLNVLGPGSAFAQDASPAGGIDFEVIPLAEVQTTDVPVGPAFLGLARFSFPPGAATPAGADPGSVLVVVESGEFAAEIDVPATSGQASATGTPAAAAPTGISLQPGDTVFVPAGTSSTFRNSGQDDATILAVMLFPEDPFGDEAKTTIADVAVELLAGGMVDGIPSPTQVVLAQATLGPDSSLPASAAPGPVLGLLTEGELAYTVTEGESAVSDAVDAATSERPPARAAATGSDTQIVSGAVFLEQAGTVSGLRNDGDVAAELLVVFLVPAEGAPTATPAS